jgi:hypothetical protein
LIPVHISRTTLENALLDRGPGAAGALDFLRQQLKAGRRGIVDEVDGSQSLLEDDGAGGFKTTPIAGS